MNISLRWLNRYLQPAVDATEAEAILTAAGFPLESVTPLESGDTLLDVEVTSNRGDCLSHVGLAREIAASSKRTLRLPEVHDVHGKHGNQAPARQVFALENRVPEACPTFTAQVVRGIKVGPSPRWMVEALEAVGQRSINNVVDITNWLNFEFGQPAHVFDLARLAGSRLVVRWAIEGERLKTLDGKDRILKANEVVVADGERAQSLAGVIGGFDSQVTEATTDIVLEAATWDPVAVRRAARRHRVRTDASHRFERGVDARTVKGAALRGLSLILELTGGELAPGMLVEGRKLEPVAPINFRPSRCNALLGTDILVSEMIGILRALEIEVSQRDEDTLVCTPPAWRSADLTREVDLIEEVARIRGMDSIPVRDRLPVALRPAQASERARREIAGVLHGLGFYETVTFSFTSPGRATPFLDAGREMVAVDDERRAHEPALRPSLIPSLLACRRANQDGQVAVAGGVRLYERAQVFAQAPGGLRQTLERTTLTLLMDVAGSGRKRSVEDMQSGVRMMRGAVEAVARAVAGPGASVSVRPVAPSAAGWDAATHVALEVSARGSTMPLGRMGLVSADVMREYELAAPVVAAELDEPVLLALYPPAASVRPLPAFPAIERDLSPIVRESVRWEQIAALVHEARLEHFEALEFVGGYRGKQVGEGAKSVTLRVRFRAPAQTLRHEDVDPQMAALMEALRSRLGAEFRTA